MAGDYLFKIPAEFIVESNIRIPLLSFAKNIGNRSPTAILRPKHSNGPVVLLDDHFDTLLYLG
jgi:hypothetical protein